MHGGAVIKFGFLCKQSLSGVAWPDSLHASAYQLENYISNG